MKPPTARSRTWRRRGAVALACAGALLATQFVWPTPAAATVRGIVAAFAATPLDLTSEKTAVAVCPAGKRVIGGGGRTLNTDRDVILTRLAPVHGLTEDSYAVTGRVATAGTSVPWLVQAWALCADPPRELEIVRVTATQSVSVPVSTTAICPDRKVLVGMGGEVSKYSAIQLATVAPTDASGAESLNRTRPYGVAVRGMKMGGYGAQWQATAYAICVAESVDTITGRIEVRQIGDRHVADIQCGQVESTLPLVTSVGFAHDTGPSGSEIYVDSAMPWAGTPPGSAYVAASRRTPGYPYAWGMTGYAICTR